MKYLVKKPIPLITGLLNCGDIINSEDPKYKSISFANQDFFEIYYEPIYYIGQEIIYNQHLCKVKEIISNKRYDIMEEGSENHYTITDKSKVTIPKRFWFINSNGIISSDIEERKKINKAGLEFKKLIGNYFPNEDMARKYKENLLKTKNK